MKIVIPIKWLVDMAGLEGDWSALSVYGTDNIDSYRSRYKTIEVTLIPDRTITFQDPPDYTAADVVAEENPRPEKFVDTEFPERGWKEMLEGIRRYLAW